jgi:hypothetical protein
VSKKREKEKKVCICKYEKEKKWCIIAYLENSLLVGHDILA